MLRADTEGALEAIENYIYQLVIPNNELRLNVIERSTGMMEPGSIGYYDDENVVIVAFNSKINTDKVHTSYVQIVQHNVIHQLIRDFCSCLEDKMDPIISYEQLGKAVINQVYTINGNTAREFNIAGCTILDGKLVKEAYYYRVYRGTVCIHEQLGATQLKHFKKDVQELANGRDCGIRLDFNSFQAGDEIHCCKQVKTKKTIDIPTLQDSRNVGPHQYDQTWQT